MFPVEMTAVASYLPDKIVLNDDLTALVDTSDEWISSRTGIRQRHISLTENTSDLCVHVANRLLEKTGLAASDLGLIIVATMSPDSMMPSTACIVHHKIGAGTAFAFDVNAACTGFIYALSIAEKYIASGLCRHAMVLGAETVSKLMNWSDRSTCVLFGDGAGGVILSRSARPSSSFLAEDLHSDGTDHMSIHTNELPVENPFTGLLSPQEKVFYMDGRGVWNFATKRVPESIRALLEKTGATLDDVNYIVPHQANARIVDILAKKLCFPLEKFFVNIEHTGNTSAASIPIALTEMEEKGLLKFGNGDRVILTGFGAGLTWGSIFLQI